MCFMRSVCLLALGLVAPLAALAADNGVAVDHSQYANRPLLPDFTASDCPSSPRSLEQINGNLYRHTTGTGLAVYSGLVLITVFLATTTLCALVVSELLFPGEMEVWMFIKINIYAIILYWAISGIVFFGSAIADDSKVSLGIGVGVPVLFLVIQMLAGAGKDFKWLENFTMYTLFNPEMMIEGDGFVWIGMATLFAIALVFYSAGIWYFNRKNLYI